MNFATCLTPREVKPATRRHNQRRARSSNQRLLKFVVYLASTPRENRLLFPFDGNAGNVLFICMWHRKVLRIKRKKWLYYCTQVGWNCKKFFYTLAPEDEAQNNFDNSVAILDKYFTPKVNVPFERYGFRQMAQLQSETIDQFVCRLRQKAVSCEFDKVDEAIRDQLIEKCRDPELRKKFLEKAQDGTLTVLQDVARVHESVILQMQSLEISSKDDQVNAVRPVNPKWRKNKMKKKKPDKKDVRPGEHQKCYRCNETGHFVHSCPALNKTCNKCGFTGHLAVCCKTKNPKRPPSGRHNPNVNGAYQVEEGSDQRDAYALLP